MRAHWPVVAAQLVGNAVLLGLGYYWLGLGASSTLALLWSVFVAAVMLLFAVALHGGTFAHFAGGNVEVRMLRRRMLPLLAACAVISALYLLLAMGAGHTARPAFRIASYLTLHLRKPVRPASVQKIFWGAFWLLRWMVVPVLVLPVVAAVAMYGWKGFLGGRPVHRWW